MFLENPVYLLFFAPDDIPIVVPGLSPLSTAAGIVDAVFEGSFEFDVGAVCELVYGGLG